MTKQIVTVLFFAFFISSYSQIDKNALQGTWKLTKQESDFELEEDFNGNPITETVFDIILQFEENWNLNISQHGIKAKTNYHLKDSILLLGNREYKILSLTSDLLILTDLNFGVNKDFYVKTPNRLEPVKENEFIEERYDSGQLKVKGKRNYGFQHGTWTEWYENGQKKSERSFIGGIPIGTWKEWDENGKLIREKKWH